MKLIGSKVILRDFIFDDLEQFKFWNTGNKKWMEFDGPYYPKMTKAELENRITIIKDQIKLNSWSEPRYRLVIAHKESNKFLGTISWYWQSKETNWKSIGIVICDEKAWGKAIGFDALSLWIDYLFKQDETLARLDLRTWSGNAGMIKLAQKLGFSLEATFRKARVVKGEFYDSIGMGILREEWAELNDIYS